MTESEWLDCADPKAMLRDQLLRVGERKLRLIACALCRLVWDRIFSSECIETIERGESLADDPRDWNIKGEGLASLRINTFTGTLHRSGNLGAQLALYWSTEIYVESRKYFEKGAEGMARITLERKQCDVIRDIVGNPFQPMLVRRPEWFTLQVMELANSVYEKRAENGVLDHIGLLALCDALEETGCIYPALAASLRQNSTVGNFRGFWSLDFVLGRG